ncbi:MAG: 2-oxo acid dehydrogenase subunit E2 [Verrucomicrobia bacterium]|jgi:pyruvate dehydrogenase E2 component (dihydrolipoamide acetyltransferase)|nr:2-oxo acid dehydrogenase subunit E2 [Verrucomicrobiota bacterium]
MDVKLPKLGEGADSGVVVNVFVKEGDTVVKDQPVIELENEKAVAAIPSSAAGVVAKIFVKAGDQLSVGQRILSLTETGKPAEPVTLDPPTKDKPASEPETAASAVGEAGEEEIPRRVAAPVASPSIRKLARELGLDLSRVRGSEAGGRISLADLRAFIQRLQKAATAKSGDAHGVTRPTTAAEQFDFSKWGPVTKKALTPLRQVIARRMWENWNAIPHVTQFDEADFSNLNELRKQFAPAYEAKGTKLTFTPLILKAVADMLKKHPLFNSSLDEVAHVIVLKEYIHIGIAVDTEAGLIVPVIRDVDKKSVLDLSKELEQLAQKARDRKITADELKGGTFTISNQGAIGGSHFTPIINKPEVAILGLGRGAMKPIVRDGKVEVSLMTPLGLSYDHRVIDGGAAARFIVDLVAALQEFKKDAVKI